jgi:V8-like Glu-specific endopeptidase
MAQQKKDPEQESVSSEEEGSVGSSEVPQKETEAEGNEDAELKHGGSEIVEVSQEKDEEEIDEIELLEDESEGDEEYGLEDVPGFEEAALETAEGFEDVIVDEELEALPKPGAEEFEQPESVCGRDDRVRIRATTRIPWRWNCQLIITMRDGRRSRCTGWLIGPRTVITAGHCVYSHSAGGWARSIEVIPGMDANRRPFGSLVGRSFRSVIGWVNGRKSTHDYGAIILPRCNFRRLGYFGFCCLSSGTLRNLLVNNAGYAGDKPFGTLWYNAGRIRRVTSRRLYYMIDTYGGHSGSCVWLLKRVRGRWQRYGVGIHGYGGCPNKAVRIVSPVFNNLKRWKTEGRC